MSPSFSTGVSKLPSRTEGILLCRREQVPSPGALLAELGSRISESSQSGRRSQIWCCSTGAMEIRGLSLFAPPAMMAFQPPLPFPPPFPLPLPLPLPFPLPLPLPFPFFLPAASSSFGVAFTLTVRPSISSQGGLKLSRKRQKNTISTCPGQASADLAADFYSRDHCAPKAWHEPHSY